MVSLIAWPKGLVGDGIGVVVDVGVGVEVAVSVGMGVELVVAVRATCYLVLVNCQTICGVEVTSISSTLMIGVSPSYMPVKREGSMD